MADVNGLSLDAWRRLQLEGEEARLPSGLTVRLKRVNVMDLAKQGEIPETLEANMQRAMQGGGTLGLQEALEMSDLIDLVCRASLVGPEGLAVSELPFADRMAIFTFCNDVGDGLRLFREESEKRVPAGQNGQGVRTAAQRLLGAGRR